MGRKHFRVPVADPYGGFPRHAHVVQSQVKLACVNPAVPHHDAIGHRYPCQAICFTKINTIGKVRKRRCHAAIHILCIRQTAEGAGLPFRRFYAPCGLESQFVFAAALD